MSRALVLLGAAGSAGLLLAAWAFQHLGGLAPCALCLWQRWPHGAAVALGVMALMLPGPLWPMLAGLAMVVGAGLGGYHTGVERGWWAGPSTCAGGDVGALSPEELMAQIMAAPLVRCDEVAWSLLGLSMASWNMLACLGLAAVWVAAARLRQAG